VGQAGGSVAVVGARLRRNVTEPAADPPTALLVRDGVIELLGTDGEVRAVADAAAVRVIDVRGCHGDPRPVRLAHPPGVGAAAAGAS
jgi:hypothetical protein